MLLLFVAGVALVSSWLGGFRHRATDAGGAPVSSGERPNVAVPTHKDRRDPIKTHPLVAPEIGARVRVLTHSKKPAKLFPLAVRSGPNGSVNHRRTDTAGIATIVRKGSMPPDVSMTPDGPWLGSPLPLRRCPGGAFEVVLPRLGALTIDIRLPSSVSDSAIGYELHCSNAEISRRKVASGTLTGNAPKLRWPHVQVGMTFEVAFATPWGVRRYAIVGPSAADEQVHSKAHLRRFVVRGRMIEASGSALAAQPLRMRLRYESSQNKESFSGRWTRIQTLKNGEFEFSPGSEFNGLTRDSCLPTTLQVSATPNGELQGVTVPLSRESDREQNVGDVTIRKYPILVSGIVIDNDNNPIGGAMVGLRRRSSPSNVPADTRLRVTTQQNGRFAFHGERAGIHSLSPHASHRQYVFNDAETTNVPPGVEDLRIRGRRPCTVTGTVSGVDATTASAVIPRLVGVDQHPSHGQGFMERGTGRFKFRHVHPGVYRVEIWLPRSRAPIIRHERIIRLTDGQEEDVGNIELPIRVQKLRVQVKPLDGGVIRTLQIRDPQTGAPVATVPPRPHGFERASNPNSLRSINLEALSGLFPARIHQSVEASVTVTPSTGPLEVLTPGYAPAVFQPTTESSLQEVVLSPGPEFLIRIKKHTLPPGIQLRVFAEVRLADGAGGTLPVLPPLTDVSNGGEFRVRAAGAGRVSFLVGLVDAQHARRRRSHTKPRVVSLPVKPSSNRLTRSGDRFDLSIEATALEEAAARFR